MKDDILTHLNDARKLEKIYRSNKLSFKRAFSALYPDIKGNTLADFWNERLNYESDEINWGTARELSLVIVICLLAGLVAKLPSFFSLAEDLFYARNVGFIIFPGLMAYFAWKNNLPIGKMATTLAITLFCLIFINSLPNSEKSDTLTLSCIHLLLFLWSLTGLAFVNGSTKNIENRLSYLKFNGDLLVLTTLILISGGLITGITIGLFSLIGFDIHHFYFENIVVFGLPAAPILATYLTQANPLLVGKVSPVIARLFSPVVLVMLVIYLAAIVYSGKDPYNDREFLLIFNCMLIGVMALIFFSVAGTSKSTKSQAEVLILFLLSVITIIVNGIALSAIMFRISEWGVTPNRAAVLGSNILILVNLLLVTGKLYRVLLKKGAVNEVGKVIALYLPIYWLWTTIVTFLFPFIFQFQ